MANVRQKIVLQQAGCPRATRRVESPCRLLIAGLDLRVALVAARVDPAVGQCIIHRARYVVFVRAVGKAESAHLRPQVAKVAGDFFGNHVLQLELTDAGRIDHEAADRQRQ
jgi:hypothetical protein